MTQGSGLAGLGSCRGHVAGSRCRAGSDVLWDVLTHTSSFAAGSRPPWGFLLAGTGAGTSFQQDVPTAGLQAGLPQGGRWVCDLAAATQLGLLEEQRSFAGQG